MREISRKMATDVIVFALGNVSLSCREGKSQHSNNSMSKTGRLLLCL